MKLELKHLASYLPYDLQIEPLYQSMGHMGGFHNKTLSIDVIYNYELEDIKPILRSLSDLTKEIEVNGKKFVPLIELFENSLPPEFVNRCKILSTDRVYYYEVGYRDSKTKHDFSFRFNKNILRNDYTIVEKLFEWHFDLFELIPQGKAIDINTLNK